MAQNLGARQTVCARDPRLANWAPSNLAAFSLQIRSSNTVNGAAYTAPSDQMGIRSIHNRGRGLLGYIRADNFDHLSWQRSNCSFCKSDRAYSEWVEGMGCEWTPENPAHRSIGSVGLKE